MDDVERLLARFKGAMVATRRSSSDDARYGLIAGAVRQLEEIEERASAGDVTVSATYLEARDAISSYAIDVEQLDTNRVQHMIAEGVRSARQATPQRADSVPANGHDAGFRTGPDGLELAPEPARPLPPLPWLDMAGWDDEPIPERLEAIPGRVPLGQAGLFSGEGGAGKSLIELHKDVCHVAGSDWLFSLPRRGPIFYLAAEDDEREIRIRLAAIVRHCGVSFRQLVAGGFHLLPLFGQDAVLCAGGKSGKVETTPLYAQLLERAGDIKPVNISVDTLSRCYTGNEINRAETYQFAAHMQRLAHASTGSVTILAHPSLHGQQSGTGISGSTAWHGAFRFRHYLTGVKPADGEQPDGALRSLEFRKHQYGPLGQALTLRFHEGLYLPLPGVSSLDAAAREARADDVFLTLLRRYTREGRSVGHATGTSYAPAQFVREAEATGAGLTRHELEGAMRRALKDGRVVVVEHGPPSKRRRHLEAS